LILNDLKNYLIIFDILKVTKIGEKGGVFNTQSDSSFAQNATKNVEKTTGKECKKIQ
jgi:hypothetical protein